MERRHFLQQVQQLRAEGNSIRAIAAQLRVNRGRVERAVKALAHNIHMESRRPDDSEPSNALNLGAFVGRYSEMALLQEAFYNAIGEQGQLIILAGEPGIGKTRTAQELSAYAGAQGAQTLWGWSYEGEGAPPYWPWVQALRPYILQHDPEQVRIAMGSGVAEVAEIIPDLREILPDLAPLPAVEPEQARFRLFCSVSTFLKNASQLSPLVIVLEDLHWADRSSLLLLEFITHNLRGTRLLLVGTHRDVRRTRHHPLYHALGSLIRMPYCRRVHLAGLIPMEVKDFVEANAGFIPNASLIQAIYERTQGNPLFLTELVRLLCQGGPEEERSLKTHIPDGVQAAIGRRLNRLSEPCNRMLTTAAVIGREFEFQQLKALNDNLAEDVLLRLVDEALEAHLIEGFFGNSERYQFNHTLVQETLLRELSPSWRVRLHAHVAEALEEVYGSNTEAHAAELAYHFSQGQAVLGAEKFIQYSKLAGEQALASYGYEEAVTQFKRALAAKERNSLDADGAAMLFGLGRAQAALYQREEALEHLIKAFHYYASEGNITRCIDVATYPLPTKLRDAKVIKLIHTGLRLVQPGSTEEGRILAHFGRVVGTVEGDREGALEAFNRAFTIAREQNDVLLEIRVLCNSMLVDAWHLKLEDSLGKSSQALELFSLVEDPASEFLLRIHAALILVFTGFPEKAGPLAKTSAILAEQLRDRYYLVLTLWTRQLRAQLQGNWRAARQFSDQGLSVAPREGCLLLARCLLEYEVGNFDEGRTYFRQLLEGTTIPASSEPIELAQSAFAIATVSRIVGVVAESNEIEPLAGNALSSPHISPAWANVARGSMALAAILKADAALAAEEYHALQDYGGQFLVNTSLSISHLLGLLSAIQGHLEESFAHFEDALSLSRRAGYRPELAWTCYDYAETMVRLGNSCGLEKVVSLLQEALDISKELGMQPLTSRTTKLLEGFTARLDKVRGYPAGLSLREVEVLRLIGLGKTNRHIAADLSISLNTVAKHVQNILNKTGAGNRAEATAYASRHNLM